MATAGPRQQRRRSRSTACATRPATTSGGAGNPTRVDRDQARGQLRVRLPQGGRQGGLRQRHHERRLRPPRPVQGAPRRCRCPACSGPTRTRPFTYHFSFNSSKIDGVKARMDPVRAEPLLPLGHREAEHHDRGLASRELARPAAGSAPAAHLSERTRRRSRDRRLVDSRARVRRARPCGRRGSGRTGRIAGAAEQDRGDDRGQQRDRGARPRTPPGSRRPPRGSRPPPSSRSTPSGSRR